MIQGDSRLRRSLFAAVLCSSNLLGSSAIARPLYTHFLFFPKKTIKAEPRQIDGVIKQNVRIKVNDGYLSGWYFAKADSPYVVLVNHGNSGNISSVKWIAHNLLKAGASVLLYDYRGYGESSKRVPDVQSICEDGDAAFDFLHTEKGFASENIVLYGQSLGCAVACHIGEKNKVAGLILQSGFSSLRNVAFQRFPFLQHTPKLVPDALDNQSILSSSKLPVLVIHGDKDRVVPFENAEYNYSAAAGEKWLVVCPNSGHKLYPESDGRHSDAVNLFMNYLHAQARKCAESEPEQKALKQPVGSITTASQPGAAQSAQ